MPEKQVVFILGVGHSGGTLLGNILDVHPQVLHIGEIPTPLARGHAFRCYYCGEKLCPIWGGVLPEAFVRKCYAGFRRSKRKRWRLMFPLMEALGVLYGPGRLHERIFSSLPEVRVVVDKSLELDWVKWNSRNSRFESRYLLLVRDLRGIVASRWRKYPNRSVREWAAKQGEALGRVLEFYDQLNEKQKEVVRYEDLVLCPERTLARVCQFLGIAYTVDFLEYFRYEHHVIGGNRNVFFQALHHKGIGTQHLLDDMRDFDIRYYRSRPGFRLDLRWREELEKADLQAIEEEVGFLQRRFGYC